MAAVLQPNVLIPLNKGAWTPLHTNNREPTRAGGCDGGGVAVTHVQRVDAGKVREAGVGDLRAPAHVQRVDAGEVREAGVGDLRASLHV